MFKAVNLGMLLPVKPLKDGGIPLSALPKDRSELASVFFTLSFYAVCSLFSCEYQLF